jgi:hypothetical protein
MTPLLSAVLLLALGGEGASPDLETPASRIRLDSDPEGLEDLYRRVPELREDERRQEGEKQEKQEPPTPPKEPGQAESSTIDWNWLELFPRVGVAMFSSKYHVNPSPTFGVGVRAPMPWLSPSSNPDGDYFGVFAELDVSVIKRTIVPTLDNPSGPIFMVGFGIDYTIHRSESWLLMLEAGAHYVNFGGITDLTNGVTPVFGVLAGISVSRGISMTFNAEFEYPKTGDYIILATIGLVWEF